MSVEIQRAAGGIDVRYVANLARLHITDEEVRTFQLQLEEVVAYIRKIGALPLDGIEPTSHAHPVVNIMRADEARPGLDRARVLANAPAAIQDQFMVPRIIE